MTRTEARFAKCGDDIRIYERMGNRLAAKIARAEWQYLYNTLGVTRAREVLDVKYAERG